MKQFTVRQIGTMEMDKDGMYVKLLPEYIPALKSLEGFGHADILWWFDGCDDEENRSVLEAESPISRGRIQWAYLQPGPPRGLIPLPLAWCRFSI